MDALFRFQNNVLRPIKSDFFRYLYHQIDWTHRLIGIKGLRGVGKTTLLLQHLKFDLRGNDALYVTADHPYFYDQSLLSLAEEFESHGGRVLIIDEVHKYPRWSQELKNIYDGLPALQVVFTSSSALDILKGEADLSRRAVIYPLNGLSLREYLHFSEDTLLPVLSLQQIFEEHQPLSKEISDQIKPLPAFQRYLKQGYFPFGVNLSENDFYTRLTQVINTILEVDLSYIEDYSSTNVQKIKALLGVISEIVPYQPNITSLAKKLTLGRDTVLNYLYNLSDAQILNFAFKQSKGMTSLSKPSKIFLGNTNLSYALKSSPNVGNLRETFALNQLLNANQSVSLPSDGDFLLNEQYTLEIGGKNKGDEQIKGVENAFVLADEIEVGFYNKIPLWLLGFLY